MSDSAKEKEDPSIEEILASIRQIISDDDDAADQGVSELPPAPVNEQKKESQADIDSMFDAPTPEPEEEDEVIELTERLEEDGSITDMDSEPAEEKEVLFEEPVVESVEDEALITKEIEVDLSEIREEIEKAGEELDSEILTQEAAAATLAGFKKLARDIQITRSLNSVTLEDIVRAQLEPLLKQWLDKQLPSMIEKMVQKELEKISKKVIGE